MTLDTLPLAMPVQLNGLQACGWLVGEGRQLRCRGRRPVTGVAKLKVVSPVTKDRRLHCLAVRGYRQSRDEPNDRTAIEKPGWEQMISTLVTLPFRFRFR